MVHHAQVLQAILPEVCQIIGKSLSLGVMLPEIADAGVQGVPAGIDDLRLRQDEVEKADGGKIVRHLVDEKRRAFSAVQARVIDVIFAQGG